SLAPTAANVVVGQLPYGVRERGPDTALPADVCVHGLSGLAAVGCQVARVVRRAAPRGDPALRPAALHRRHLLLELVGAFALDGDLPVLRTFPGARPPRARRPLLLL